MHAVATLVGRGALVARGKFRAGATVVPVAMLGSECGIRFRGRLADWELAYGHTHQSSALFVVLLL